MSAHVAGHWWAIERRHIDGPYAGRWRLQWENDPCWPRLFRTRAEVRRHLAERHRSDDAWARKYWRLRPVEVTVVPV